MKDLCPPLIALWLLMLMAYSSPNVQASISGNLEYLNSLKSQTAYVNDERAVSSNTANILNSITNTASANTGAVGTACFTFTRDIGFGTSMTAKELVGLNKVLMGHKVISTGITSRKFNETTAGYVADYQTKMGLKATGVIGQTTRAKMAVCTPVVQRAIEIIRPAYNESVNVKKNGLVVEWSQKTNTDKVIFKLSGVRDFYFDKELKGGLGLNKWVGTFDELQTWDGQYSIQICDINAFNQNSKEASMYYCNDSDSFRFNIVSDIDPPIAPCPVGFICYPTSTNTPQLDYCPAGYVCQPVATSVPVMTVLTKAQNVETNLDSTNSDDVGRYKVRFLITARDREMYVKIGNGLGVSSSIINGANVVDSGNAITGISVIRVNNSQNITTTAINGSDYVLIPKDGYAEFDYDVIFDPAVTGFYRLRINGIEYYLSSTEKMPYITVSNPESAVTSALQIMN